MGTGAVPVVTEISVPESGSPLLRGGSVAPIPVFANAFTLVVLMGVSDAVDATCGPGSHTRVALVVTGSVVFAAVLTFPVWVTDAGTEGQDTVFLAADAVVEVGSVALITWCVAFSHVDRAVSIAELLHGVSYL